MYLEIHYGDGTFGRYPFTTNTVATIDSGDGSPTQVFALGGAISASVSDGDPTVYLTSPAAPAVNDPTPNPDPAPVAKLKWAAPSDTPKAA